MTTETNPTPPAWALAKALTPVLGKAYIDECPLEETRARIVECVFEVLAGYEAASAHPAVEGGRADGIKRVQFAMVAAYHKRGGIDAAQTGLINVERYMAEAAYDAAMLAAAPPPPVRGSIKDHLPSQDWLRSHVEADPDCDTEAGSPPPPVGDHRALIAEAEALYLRSSTHQHAKLLDDWAQRVSPVSVSASTVKIVLALLDEHEAMIRRLAAALSQRGADEGAGG